MLLDQPTRGRSSESGRIPDRPVVSGDLDEQRALKGSDCPKDRHRPWSQNKSLLFSNARTLPEEPRWSDSRGRRYPRWSGKKPIQGTCSSGSKCYPGRLFPERSQRRVESRRGQSFYLSDVCYSQEGEAGLTPVVGLLTVVIPASSFAGRDKGLDRDLFVMGFQITDE